MTTSIKQENQQIRADEMWLRQKRDRSLEIARSLLTRGQPNKAVKAQKSAERYDRILKRLNPYA